MSFLFHINLPCALVRTFFMFFLLLFWTLYHRITQIPKIKCRLFRFGKCSKIQAFQVSLKFSQLLALTFRCFISDMLELDAENPISSLVCRTENNRISFFVCSIRRHYPERSGHQADLLVTRRDRAVWKWDFAFHQICFMCPDLRSFGASGPQPSKMVKGGEGGANKPNILFGLKNWMTTCQSKEHAAICAAGAIARGGTKEPNCRRSNMYDCGLPSKHHPDDISMCRLCETLSNTWLKDVKTRAHTKKSLFKVPPRSYFDLFQPNLKTCLFFFWT